MQLKASQRSPQLPVRPEISDTPHPPKITPDCIKVNFHTEDSSTSEVSPSQVILEQPPVPRFYPSGAICSQRFPISLQRFPATAIEMFACSYASSFSLTFIMCNTSQRGLLWTMVRFPACNPNSPTPITAAITINQHGEIVHWGRSDQRPIRLYANSWVYVDLFLQ